MNFLSFIGAGAICFVIYSVWSSYQTGLKKAEDLKDLALSDYMKVKRSVQEWKSNPASADAEGRAIAAAQFFRDIIKAHDFSSAAQVKTKEDALRFTYCKHFAQLKSIDDDYLHGDSEFICGLGDVAELEHATALRQQA